MSSMVRSFILNEAQRQMIEDYLREMPPAMGPQVRQLRFRVLRLNLDIMESDLNLLRRLAALRPTIGRKSKDVMASFMVRYRQAGDVSASFAVSKSREGDEKNV